MKLTYLPIPTRIERSVLITPASNYSMMAKAAAAGADAICFDLEDAVAPAEKESSRANIVKAFRELDFGRSTKMFRINGLDTYFAYRDIIEVVEAAGDKLDLIMVPKVNGAEDVYMVDTLLSQIESYKGFTNTIGIEVLIETATGCLRVDEIAASSTRLETLIFGSGDYAASVQMPLDSIGEFDENDKLYPGHRWHSAMHHIVMAARAYGKRCVDGAFAGIADIEGYRRACEIARVKGFDGKWSIHPTQIPVAKEVFSFPEKQVQWARHVLSEYDKALKEGKGAIAVNGKMVDAANLRMARTIIEKEKLAEQFTKKK